MYASNIKLIERNTGLMIAQCDYLCLKKLYVNFKMIPVRHPSKYVNSSGHKKDHVSVDVFSLTYAHLGSFKI